jgi:hypothetical protein
MPDVHPDFSEAKLLPLAAKPITADEAKKRYVTSRSTLHVIHKNWLSLGSGRSMLSGTAEANNVYEFVDKDDRQDFLGGNASHILYFWQIGWQHQVLNTITQTLCYAATADGTRVARVASSPDTKKQKRLTTSNSSNNNTSISSSEMKSKFDQSFLHVNKVTTIQALLESKQRELAQVCDKLGCFVETKISYELDHCVTDNEAKKDLLCKAIQQFNGKIVIEEQRESELKEDIAKLQSQLEDKIVQVEVCVQKTDYSISSDSE